VYTQLNSKVGNFANVGATDFRPAKQAKTQVLSSFMYKVQRRSVLDNECYLGFSRYQCF